MQIAIKRGVFQLNVIIILNTNFKHSTASRFSVMPSYARTFLYAYSHYYETSDNTFREDKIGYFDCFKVKTFLRVRTDVNLALIKMDSGMVKIQYFR